MDVITMAKQLAVAISKDEGVVAYNRARENSDNDAALQKMIGDFNLKRIDLNSELAKSEKDMHRITELDTEIKGMYSEIMQNEHMAAYNEAKNVVDKLMDYVNRILAAGVNNENPEEVPEEENCQGNCSGCSGCN